MCEVETEVTASTASSFNSKQSLHATLSQAYGRDAILVMHGQQQLLARTSQARTCCRLLQELQCWPASFLLCCRPPRRLPAHLDGAVDVQQQLVPGGRDEVAALEHIGQRAVLQLLAQQQRLLQVLDGAAVNLVGRSQAADGTGGVRGRASTATRQHQQPGTPSAGI